MATEVILTDLSRFTKAEQMFIGASGLLFITSFLDLWVKAELGGDTVQGNAADFGGLGGFLPWISLAGLVVGLAKIFGKVTMPPVTFAAVGGAIFAVLVLMVILGPDDEGAGVLGVEVSRGLFLFIGLLIGAVAAYGGYLMMKDAEAPGPAAPPPTAPPPAAP